MATENKEAEQQYQQQRAPAPVLENTAFDKYANPSTWAENQGIKFSVVFPTRDRQDLLDNLLKSLEMNTHDLRTVEVLIAVDYDDKETQDFMDHNWRRSWIKTYNVERSGYLNGAFDKSRLNFSRDYYTYLAKASKGRWIITANDDCVFETPNWDALAYEVLKNKPGVIYGWIGDGLDNFRAPGHGNYCCFPLQGRAGFEALGYIFPSRIPTWGADIWAKSLYDQINGVIEIPITLRHFCHHNKTREQDAISKRIAHNQVPFDMRPTYDEVNRLLEARKAERVKV